MTSASPLSPTFYGHIASTQDALLLFEACLSGALNHVARRPHDRERVSLIKSGNVFIYEEHSSGIKRWTDGVPWSPSRILGNFLVYRELERPFPPGEKKRAMKRSKRSPGINKPDPFGASHGGGSNGYLPAAAAAAAAAASAAVSNFDAQSPSSLSKETERSLIGSLVDSYGFKEEGLVKKTVSVTVGGVSHHLVSYYTVADVMNNKFTTPSKDPRFQHITPRPDLITKQNFRTPIDEVDSMDRIDDRSVYASYPYARSGYEMTNQTMAHRPMSLPTPPMTYASHPTIYTSYGQYEGLAPAHAQTGYGGPFTAPSPGLTPAPKPEHYEVGAYRPQRYNSVIGIGSEARAHVPPVTTTFARRPSSYEHAGSADSGLSGISATSTDSKLTNDSGYASQGFYSGMRDSATTPHSYTGHRSLPTPTHQTTFDRIPPQSYTPVESPSIKQEMWSMGNPSSGHAHYMAPQWASTGTS